MTSRLVAADAADTNIICKPHVVCRDSIDSMWLAHLVCINSTKVVILGLYKHQAQSNSSMNSIGVLPQGDTYR